MEDLNFFNNSFFYSEYYYYYYCLLESNLISGINNTYFFVDSAYFSYMFECFPKLYLNYLYEEEFTSYLNNFYYNIGYIKFNTKIIEDYENIIDFQGNLWWFWFHDDHWFNYEDYFEYVEEKITEYRIKNNTYWLEFTMDFFEDYNDKMYIHDMTILNNKNYFFAPDYLYSNYFKFLEANNYSNFFEIFFSGRYVHDLFYKPRDYNMAELYESLHDYIFIDFHKLWINFFYENYVTYWAYDEFPYRNVNMDYLMKLDYLNSFNYYQENGFLINLANNFFFKKLFNYSIFLVLDVNIEYSNYLNMYDCLSIEEGIRDKNMMNMDIAKYLDPFKKIIQQKEGMFDWTFNFKKFNKSLRIEEFVVMARNNIDYNYEKISLLYDYTYLININTDFFFELDQSDFFKKSVYFNK